MAVVAANNVADVHDAAGLPNEASCYQAAAPAGRCGQRNSGGEGASVANVVGHLLCVGSGVRAQIRTARTVTGWGTVGQRLWCCHRRSAAIHAVDGSRRGSRSRRRSCASMVKGRGPDRRITSYEEFLWPA